MISDKGKQGEGRIVRRALTSALSFRNSLSLSLTACLGRSCGENKGRSQDEKEREASVQKRRSSSPRALQHATEPANAPAS